MTPLFQLTRHIILHIIIEEISATGNEMKMNLIGINISNIKLKITMLSPIIADF